MRAAEVWENQDRQKGNGPLTPEGKRASDRKRGYRGGKHVAGPAITIDRALE